MSGNCSISSNVQITESVQSFLYDYESVSGESKLGTFCVILVLLDHMKGFFYRF